jgi:hypothetical protein
MSDDDPFWSPTHHVDDRRTPKPRERLFAFLRGHDRFLFELVDHGEYGVEVQISKNEEFLFGRRFDPRLDRLRPPRDLAVAWAHEERKAIETR